MRRPEYKLLKNKAIKIKNKELAEDGCTQCIGIDVIENGEQYVYKAAEQIFTHDPLFTNIYSMPMERLNLERKVGDGIFPVRRCISAMQRRNQQYDRFINKCEQILQDPNNPQYDESSIVLLNYYKRIHARTMYIRDKMKIHEERENMREDYRFASMALDRLCLCMFSIFISICVLIIFLSPPYLYA
uniref:Neurotransmitter-gated ion-channel transmembrane domain-containing protein n=1 Tax=Panagrolaimus davidi TaxID=227884 RepID=A0A914QSF5_9BILA